MNELKQFYDIDDKSKKLLDKATKYKPASYRTSKKSKKVGSGANEVESRIDYLHKLSRGEISEDSSSEGKNSREIIIFYLCMSNLSIKR